MCGIAGIVSLVNRPIDNIKKRTQNMLFDLNERGPDSSGYWINENQTLTLVNTRLSITGIKDNFNIPFITNSNKSILSYNGEIYNYKDLNKFINFKGKVTKFKSDTEILAEGLELKDISFLDNLDGFWSFAFYNKETNNLLLSRDLMGEKGLYYLINKDELIFSSDVRCILNASKESHEIDYSSLISSIAFRSPPPHTSLIKGLSKVSPGSSISINLSNGNIKKIFNQKFNLEPWLDFFNSNPSEKKILDTYDEYLYNAISIRVPNEVNFYSTLSGGIDSALINIYIKEYTNSVINTVYLHSNHSPPIKESHTLSEYEASLISSKNLNTNHESISIFTEMGFKNYSTASAESFDGIFCEGLPSFATISEYIKNKKAKVLILSDGPDDFLGGYERDKNLYQEVVSNNSDKLYNKHFKFSPIHGGTSEFELKNIFSNEILREFKPIYGTIDKKYSLLENELDVSQKMALSYALYSLPDHFNTRIDRGTMMHSIEARVPLQSVSLANIMIATPGKWKYKNNMTKYPLRKIVERYLGKKIAFRKKHGFAFPIWKNKYFSDKLNIMNSIIDSQLFKSNFINPNFSIMDDRLKYMLFCATQTYDALNHINKNKRKI